MAPMSSAYRIEAESAKAADIPTDGFVRRLKRKGSAETRNRRNRFRILTPGASTDSKVIVEEYSDHT